MKDIIDNRRHGRQNMVMIIFMAALLVIPGISFGAPIPNRESAADPNLQRAGPILVPHRETAEDPNQDRRAPIPSPTLPGGSKEAPSAAPAPAPAAALAPAASSFGPNLVPNPGLDTAGQSGLPANWHKGGYGSSTRTLTYPVPGESGSGIEVAVSNYASGDAKWYPDDMPVSGGKTYEFSDAYKSTAASIVTIRFALSGGTFIYKDILTLPASAAYTSATVQFAAPAGAVSATIFHLIKSNGTLDTDDYVLREVTTTSSPPPPPSGQSSVLNGDFETAGSGGLPAHWIRGGYGSNTRVFTYPVSGQSGNGAQITVSGYASGDAKWAHEQVALPPGAYTYTDSYKASVPTILTAEFQRADGSFFYSDLKTLPAASSWTTATAALSVPSSAVKTRVFHLIKGNGTLSIDNVAITASSASSGIFSTGAVTFRLDDGLNNQYSVAAPVLDAAGFKGTFYIVSRETADNGFSGFMSKAQVQDLAARGHEIGAHTRTHPHLTTLTSQQEQDEISGSRQDLLGWNVGPVLSFAYPYGEYDATTLQIVRDAGFTSAAATISGYASANSDPYQLEYQELRNTVTLDQVKQWVDTAAQTHTWLILAFHDIDTSNSLYATTPGMFQSIVNYVKQKGIPVVTATQGRKSLP
jgi:peptidoglycan/xylan/chitin deacetylase (PgdA/CDA1 family)